MEKVITSEKQQNVRHSNQMISAIIAEYKKGQRTVKELCSDKGINTDTFYCWLSKQRKDSRPSTPTPRLFQYRLRRTLPMRTCLQNIKG